MARKHHKPAVPGVLWSMFGNRARTLLDTIISLLPPPPKLCRCGGGGCLGCALDAKSFLLRPEDPSEYRTLLGKCYIVISQKAPPLPSVFSLSSRLSQDKIVKTTIKQMLLRREPSNVLCFGYDKVVDFFMVYLLRNTSIFLPVPHGKHHQVGGPPISDLCFPKFDYLKYGEQKIKRADADDLPAEKRKCHNSYSTIDPLGYSSNLGFSSKSSMQLTSHHGSRNYEVNVSEVPKLTRTGTVMRKLESEGKQGSNCVTPRLGKRSRPFSWQRRSCKMQKRLTLEENGLNTHCNALPTNIDCLPASSLPNTTSLSYDEKMPWPCSCCLSLQSLPAVPKRTDIKRQSIFFNLESPKETYPPMNFEPDLLYMSFLEMGFFGSLH